MKPVPRRFLFGVLYAAGLLGVAAVALYAGRNFTGSGPVPTRSAFARRLPTTPDGDFRRCELFYATNRAADDPATFDGQGCQLGDEISTGTFAVRVSPYLPIEARVWFDEARMNWVGHSPLPPKQAFDRLRSRVQAAPQKSVLVIVWGFRDWFRSAALKTVYTAYVLDVDTPVLLFDWPGNQGEGRAGYRSSQVAASKSAPDLARTLASVGRETGAEKIWLMGSSLGCQTICEAFAWLHLHPEQFKGLPKIDHVILGAPDVPADAFDDKFADRIKALSQNLTAYVSSNDRALLMSHWINGARRLGRLREVSVPPEERTDQYQFEEALELLDLQARGLRACIVDATPINRTRNLHHFFTDSSEFFDDLYRQLLEPASTVNRRLYPVRQAEGRNYWILWNE